MTNMKLSIIILNYNTKELTKNCIDSIIQTGRKLDYEILVVDNGSTDGSVEFLKRFKNYDLRFTIIETGANLGFAKGNNATRGTAKGEYILFLNSDTVLQKDALQKTVLYLDKHSDVGAVTCKLVLADGSLDKDARRSFITPWIGLTHLFLRLDRVFPTSRIFARYWYGYISPDVTHEVDVIQGAFFLTRKKILDEVDWFDESYFLDAEDIDLSWKVKHVGYKLMYYPDVSVLHLKGATKGNNKKTKKNIPLREKLKYRLSGVNSMEIFYRKRMWKENPLVVNYLVILGIKTLKVIRLLKVVLLG
jgi:GT2 family glycosyltransferase